MRDWSCASSSTSDRARLELETAYLAIGSDVFLGRSAADVLNRHFEGELTKALFAFDGVVGTATIAQGIIRTDNFKMRGINAVVLMDGTADIVRLIAEISIIELYSRTALAKGLPAGNLYHVVSNVRITSCG